MNIVNVEVPGVRGPLWKVHVEIDHKGERMRPPFWVLPEEGEGEGTGRRNRRSTINDAEQKPPSEAGSTVFIGSRAGGSQLNGPRPGISNTFQQHEVDPCSSDRRS
jgi:hypothetical protein